jgi:hypothetical protein
LSNSPGMRGAPQSGLDRDMLRVRVIVSGATHFRPPFTRAALPFPEEAKTLRMPVDDGIELNKSKGSHPAAPSTRKPSSEGTVQQSQARSLGVPAQDQELVTQGCILEKQVVPRFKDDCGEAKHQTKPAMHTIGASIKSCRSRAFSMWMELLPTTRVQAWRGLIGSPIGWIDGRGT